MTAMVPVDINGRWRLLLPEHRAARPEWPWWEATRLAAEYHTITTTYNMARDGRRPVVWCVGAEEGDMPALYAMWGADVVLIEPNPRVWPNIRATFENNVLSDRIRGTVVALVGAPDMVDMWPVDNDVKGTAIAGGVHDDGWPICASGPVIGDHGFRHLMDGRATTPTTTIDDLVYTHGLPRPDVITMDIEGGEGHALAGAHHTINDVRPTWFVSIHPEFMRDMYRQNPDPLVWGVFDDAGYDATFLSIDHEHHWRFTP